MPFDLCKGCGKEINTDEGFCPYCEKIVEGFERKGELIKPEFPSQKPEKETKFEECKNCNARVIAGANFCQNCGAPMETAPSGNNSQQLNEGEAGGDGLGSGTIGCLMILVSMVALFFILDFFTGVKTDPSTPEEKQLNSQESINGPKPINSAWDGSVAEVKRYLQRVAKDPESLKYEAWGKVHYDGQRGWRVWCDYRGKNSFGGYMREKKWFFIKNGQVIDVWDFIDPKQLTR